MKRPSASARGLALMLSWSWSEDVVDTYNNAENTSRSRSEAVTSASIFSREDFRRDSVQDTIHDLRR